MIKSVITALFILVPTITGASSAMAQILLPQDQKQTQEQTRGMAQKTPITEAMALKYYDNCFAKSKAQGTMSEATAKSYCYCTANQMKNNMTQEDLVAMNGEDEQAARAVINKILIEVNAPCTQYPLHDLVHNECMKKTGNTPICSCLSTKMSNYIAQREQQMMTDILKQNPNVFDPLSAIMETEEYKNAERQISMGCITNPNN